MARTPGVEISNNDTATTDPSATDDANQGWDVGSHWTNTVLGKVWFCVDKSVGTAVWKDVSTPGAGSHPVTLNAVDPTVTDDTNSGFVVGDHWINTAAVPRRAFQVTDVSVGTAVWIRVTNVKINITTSDPIITNDSTEDYEISSVWVNTSNQRVFQAVDVSVGAAIWDRIDNNESGAGPGAAVNPGELMFGTLLDYPSAGTSSASEIQYVRLRFTQGLVISGIRTFIDSGGTGSRNVRMAIYDQATPGDDAGDPDTRVAQTNSVSTSGTNGTFISEAFIAGDYTVPTTGFYWIAFITDSPSLKFAVSATHRADFLPHRHETSSGTTLPATTGGLTNPVGAVIYVAGIEA